jgi:gamma-glutamyltranspeptidase
LVIGASGGAKIISGVAYVASRALWMNETVKEAMDAPRIYNQLVPNVVEHERDFDAALVQKLTGSTLKIKCPKRAFFLISRFWPHNENHRRT